jgi:hypothetical protein
VDPAAENWPAGQLTQTDSVDAPTTLDAFPGEQEVQEGEPAFAAYVPAAHDWHVVVDVAPVVVENLPTAQLVQNGALDVDE